MTVDAVCFDLDDTLFDYREYARAGLREAANRLETSADIQVHEELLELYFEKGVTDGTFDRLIDRYDLSPDVVDELVDAYHDATGTLPTYPETKRVLRRLKKDYSIGLVTDGRGGEGKLDRLGIREYFDAVVVIPSTDYTSKRNTAVFDDILSALSHEPTETMYVGDDPRFDFSAPNELKMYTVRLRRGRFVDLEPETRRDEPDYEIDRLDELFDLLETLPSSKETTSPD